MNFALIIIFIMNYGWCCNDIPNQRRDDKPNVLGKWYRSSGNNYQKNVEREDIARWYEFKTESEILYSTCTDMCGCMRMSYKGQYEWENDSVMTVNYTHSKSDLEDDDFHEIEGGFKDQLKVKKTTDGLIIKRVKLILQSADKR